jgi:hypothetical protein
MSRPTLTSSIGWIDFSPTHRNRIGTVLDLLRPEGMVDELGLGTIRDALANQLFPGISTIQTRAKYFYIIPYILYEYQQLPIARRRSKSAALYLEQREYEIMWQLADTYEHVEGHGVIGITKYKPQKIVRRPSAIYWNGLSSFKFIDTRGLSADAFLKYTTNQSLSDLLSESKSGDDISNDDADAGFENVFRIKVPPKKSWDLNLDLQLTRDEAEIFRDKIFSVADKRLLSELLRQPHLWKVFFQAESYIDFAKEAVVQRENDNLKRTMILAHDFSELMYGAHLYYNCILQQKVFQNEFYKSQWDQWVKKLRTAMIDYEGFNPEDLFVFAVTTRTGTKEFVKEWWQQAALGFKNEQKLQSMITGQEMRAKGNKARLQWNKTEDVKEERWIGLTYFEYRFNQVKTILNDIRASL